MVIKITNLLGDCTTINLYEVNVNKVPFNTYRKLKHIPYYWYFDESYKGIKPIIIVNTMQDDKIRIYSFNYKEAHDNGVNIVLQEELNIFDTYAYIHVSNIYNECMNVYLNEKLAYYKASRNIIIDSITSLEYDKNVKYYEERERLMTELEKTIEKMLDVYEERMIVLESKLKQIDKNIDMINQLKTEFDLKKCLY